jgi:Flp pilus assembly protein CpaB
MKKYYLITMLLGLTLAACATNPKQGQTTSGALEGPTASFAFAQVILATKNLPAGTVITPDLVILCGWSPSMIPAFAIGKVEDILGRKTRVEISRGTAITDSQLTEEIVKVSSSLATNDSPIFTCPDLDKRIKVVWAKHDIKSGEVISNEAIYESEWPSEVTPPNVVKSAQIIVGKTALAVIPRETIILESQVVAN